MSHSLALNRQVEAHHAAMKVRAFPIESILTLPGGELASLTQLGRQIQDQGEVRANSSGGRLISRSHEDWIQTSTRHLIGFGRECEPIGEHYSPGVERWKNNGLDQVGPCRKIKEQLGERSDRMVGIEQGLPGNLCRAGASGLAYDQGIHAGGPHTSSQWTEERGFARRLGALENDEEAAGVHPSVIMLLVAPFSIPSLICWFTRDISFSKFARATTYA